MQIRRGRHQKADEFGRGDSFSPGWTVATTACATLLLTSRRNSKSMRVRIAHNSSTVFGRGQDVLTPSVNGVHPHMRGRGKDSQGHQVFELPIRWPKGDINLPLNVHQHLSIINLTVSTTQKILDGLEHFWAMPLKIHLLTRSGKRARCPQPYTPHPLSILSLHQGYSDVGVDSINVDLQTEWYI